MKTFKVKLFENGDIEIYHRLWKVIENIKVYELNIFFERDQELMVEGYLNKRD